MLNEAEIRQIEEEAKLYANRRTVCIGALKIVQKHRGWVSDEALADLASYLGMTNDELDSVATFYSLIFRKPVGRHVVLLCDGLACCNVGYEELRVYIMKRLGIGFGETTADGRFTLLPSACLGVCESAPALAIDEDVHGNLEPPEKVDEALEKYE